MDATDTQFHSGQSTALLILRGETLRYIWRIPLVVGTLLTVVNQSRYMLDGIDAAAVVAIGINYLTPYVVSSLGFLSYQQHQGETN